MTGAYRPIRRSLYAHDHAHILRLRRTAMPANPRRATNLSIDSEVLEKARAMNINISRAAEDGVRRAISREEAKRWAEENADVIRSSNEYVEKHGLPLEKYRVF
jgi:antitoxin CcdA